MERTHRAGNICRRCMPRTPWTHSATEIRRQHMAHKRYCSMRSFRGHTAHRRSRYWKQLRRCRKHRCARSQGRTEGFGKRPKGSCQLSLRGWYSTGLRSWWCMGCKYPAKRHRRARDTALCCMEASHCRTLWGKSRSAPRCPKRRSSGRELRCTESKRPVKRRCTQGGTGLCRTTASYRRTLWGTSR